MEANPQGALTDISGLCAQRPALTGAYMSWEVITGFIAFVSLWYLVYVLRKPHQLR